MQVSRVHFLNLQRETEPSKKVLTFRLSNIYCNIVILIFYNIIIAGSDGYFEDLLLL